MHLKLFYDTKKVTVNCAHPTMYKLIACFLKEQNKVDMTVVQLKSGLRIKQRAKQTAHDARILAVVERYKSGDYEQYFARLTPLLRTV